METRLTVEDAKQSLHAHVAAKGLEIRAKYGPRIGWAELLQDRSCVRYPCEITFDAEPLQPGEIAYVMAKGDHPETGFTLYMHPLLMMNLEKVPQAALYQLVMVNYGEFASPDDAETFGATALGLSQDAYYQSLCNLVDEVGEGSR